jgi:hypothetical protein
MRKMLRACVLVIAIACTAQAGEMQNDIASQPPDTAGEMQNGIASAGTEIVILLGNLLSLF